MLEKAQHVWFILHRTALWCWNASRYIMRKIIWLIRFLPGWCSSVLLHGLLFLWIIGIPACHTEPPKVDVMRVQIMAPVSMKAEPKKQVSAPKPKTETTKRAAPPKPAPKVEKPKPPKPVQPVATPLSKPAAPKPKPVPEPVKKTEPPKPKPAPKVEKPKPSKKDTKNIDKMLNNFLEESKQKPADNSAAQKAAADRATITAVQAIQRQVEDQWTLPNIYDDRQNMQLTLRFRLSSAGALQGQVEIMQRGRYEQDATFRALVDSAIRAVYRASPFKGLDSKYHDYWGYLEMTFDPKNI